MVRNRIDSRFTPTEHRAYKHQTAECSLLYMYEYIITLYNWNLQSLLSQRWPAPFVSCIVIAEFRITSAKIAYTRVRSIFFLIVDVPTLNRTQHYQFTWRPYGRGCTTINHNSPMNGTARLILQNAIPDVEYIINIMLYYNYTTRVNAMYTVTYIQFSYAPLP